MSDYKARAAQRKAEEEQRRRAQPRARGRARVRVQLDETSEHYRSPLEQEIEKALTEVLKRMVPPGARAVAGWDAVSYCSPSHVRLVCSGSIPVMAYSCCLKPDHPGQCFSATKGVHFTPETR